jgi:hypothetical protein
VVSSGHPVKLTRRPDGALEPVTAQGARRLAEGWPVGEVREIRVPVGGRRWPQHAAYHAELAALCESMPETAVRYFYGVLLGDLARHGRINPAIMHDLVKQIVGVESESFDAMDQDAADRFFREARELLARWKSILEA